VEGEREIDGIHRIRPAARGPALDQRVADVGARGDRGGVQGRGLAGLPCEAQLADLERRFPAHQIEAPRVA
jgi:hypothetical protein